MLLRRRRRRGHCRRVGSVSPVDPTPSRQLRLTVAVVDADHCRRRRRRGSGGRPSSAAPVVGVVDADHGRRSRAGRRGGPSSPVVPWGSWRENRVVRASLAEERHFDGVATTGVGRGRTRFPAPHVTRSLQSARGAVDGRRGPPSPLHSSIVPLQCAVDRRAWAATRARHGRRMSHSYS